MRWFQLDSDTPHDPKIREVLRQVGPAGFGGLVLLWCHIADHGHGTPGVSVDAAGRPISEADLLEASHLDTDTFQRLLGVLMEVGHIDRRAWVKRRVISIPAMAKRADSYTKRLRSNSVRTVFEQSSNKVPVQTNKQTYKTNKHAAAPLWRPSVAGGTNCPHTPRCATRHACIARSLKAAKNGRKHA